MAVEYLLLETGDKLLLEDGSGLLLESSDASADFFPVWAYKNPPPPVGRLVWAGVEY